MSYPSKRWIIDTWSKKLRDWLLNVKEMNKIEPNGEKEKATEEKKAREKEKKAREKEQAKEGGEKG